MTTGCPPSVTDIPDDLPRLHLLAGGDADGRAVGIQRFQPAAVVDLDVVAVAAAPTVKTVLCLFNRMMEQTALGFTVGIERKNYWDVLYKGDYTAYYITTG